MKSTTPTTTGPQSAISELALLTGSATDLILMPRS
jgi:hypothetical protein